MKKCNLCSKEICKGSDGIEYCPDPNCDNYTELKKEKKQIELCFASGTDF